MSRSGKNEKLVPVSVFYKGRFWCKWSKPIECMVSTDALINFSALDACIRAVGGASIVEQAVQSAENLNGEREPRFLSPIGTLEVQVINGYRKRFRIGLKDALVCFPQKNKVPEAILEPA